MWYWLKAVRKAMFCSGSCLVTAQLTRAVIEVTITLDPTLQQTAWGKLSNETTSAVCSSPLHLRLSRQNPWFTCVTKDHWISLNLAEEKLTQGLGCAMKLLKEFTELWGRQTLISSTIWLSLDQEPLEMAFLRLNGNRSLMWQPDLPRMVKSQIYVWL